jgi:hypothetical protein
LGILVAAIFLSVILITPYALAIQPKLKTAKLPLPLSLLMPIQWVTTTLLYGIIAAIGLAVAGRIGLGLPFLESWLAGKPDWAHLRRFVWPSLEARSQELRSSSSKKACSLHGYWRNSDNWD